MDPFKDEDWPENTTPTNEMIGRQVKRLQNAITLSELNFNVEPHVEDSTIGDRAIKVTEMAFANITGTLNRDHADMLMGLRTVIAEACQANGAIKNAIDSSNFNLHQIFYLKRLNSLIKDPNSPIHSIPNLAGQYHAQFPENLREFWTLPVATVNLLLAHYGLDNSQGLLIDKLNRLATYVQINTMVA